MRITGVDDATYSQTGESYSAICLPNANTHTERVLQEDNTDLAYECKLRALPTLPAPLRRACLTTCLFAAVARKFPGYTAESTHRFRTTHMPLCTRSNTQRLCADLAEKGIHEARVLFYTRFSPPPHPTHT